MIEGSLMEARTELDSLRARQQELEEQIAQAEALLGGDTGTAATPARSRTLHEALVEILRGGGNEGMRARDLAEEVNRRGLYTKRDGSPVEANQVQARVNNYDALFEKEGGVIRLREGSPMLSAAPADLTTFVDDDDAFFEWLAAHPEGFFINTERNPKPNYLVLHRPQCSHFKGSEHLQWTKDYAKVCAANRSSLEEWAKDTVGGEVTLCRTCFG